MEIQTPGACSPMHVSGTCQPCACQYQVYIRTLQTSHRTFSQCFAVLTLFPIRKDPEINSENTPSHADTPSIWSYSLSPVKVSWVIEVSWLILFKPVVLLWEVVINIMINSTNKLAAFCTTGCLCQKIRQVIICSDVSN